jgi:hypothetical protein
MDPQVQAMARGAVARLAASHPDLPPHVEAAIARGDAGKSEQFIEPGTAIALAGLLLAVVKFIYDLRKDAKAAERMSRAALRRRVQLELDDRGVPATGNRDAVIEAVLDEVEAR